MRDLFVSGRCPSPGWRGFRLKGLAILFVFWLALSFQGGWVEASDRGRQDVRPPDSRFASSVSRPVIAGDIALHRGGTLQGVVEAGPGLSKAGESVAGVRVVLLRDARVVAEARTDKSGGFFVSGLRGGKYGIAVGCRDGVRWNLYRLWTSETAPSKASALARVALGGEVVRGQGALPAVSFSEAALVAGVVVGAVAAPIVYHNAQKSNRVPASP